VRVSNDGHYLVDDKGQPFFYLAATAWALFYKTTRQEADFYLHNRKDKGFDYPFP
jgi:hypothetical protein